ncbi:MAG: sugar phosphate isomerase/epimerase [Lentisphaeria bacterium]|nr:sugar phosphate isomerase/epimerase [Lentisphaeria bacterium]
MDPLPTLTCNYGPATVEQIPARLENLAAAGVKRILLEPKQLMATVDDPNYCKVLRHELDANGLTAFDAHALHDIIDSFGCPIPGAEKHILEVVRKAMHAAADFGIRTLTFHTGRTRLVNEFAPASGPIEDVDLDGARSRIMRELEILLPETEKLGVIFALENLFMPSSTAKFLTPIVREFDHPFLGLNYDSGHALLLERLPGKDPAQIAEWIRVGWPDNTITLQDDQLDLMLDHVVTAHLHDNHGVNDQHLMPGEGVANWPHIIERLKRAPRLVSLQSEVMPKYYGDDPGCQAERFRQIGFNV